MIKVFDRWEVSMDCSRKDAPWLAVWREGKESIAHHFENFTGMIGYLGMMDSYTFREYWNHQRQLANLSTHPLVNSNHQIIKS